MISKSGSTNDPHKVQLIQRQLVVLLHAQLCQRRELRQIAASRPLTKCQLPFCGEMKDVLNHMDTCQLSNHCQMKHCNTSKMILCHWRNCRSHDCPACEPIRQAQEESMLPNISSLSLS